MIIEAPKVKRTHSYVMRPSAYDICCPLNKNHKIDWSEFEKHIWCYQCEMDIYLTVYNSGVFSGPIPVNLANLLGMSFDRFEIGTDKIISHNDPEINNTWVKDPELEKFDKTWQWFRG